MIWWVRFWLVWHYWRRERLTTRHRKLLRVRDHHDLRVMVFECEERRVNESITNKEAK